MTTEEAKLPSEVQLEESPEVLVCRLPRRPGWKNAAAGFLIGSVSLLAAGVFVYFAMVLRRPGAGADVWFLLACIATVASLAGVFAALLVALGRVEISLDRERLRVREVAGPLCWPHSLPLEKVRYLRIGARQMNIEGRGVEAMPWAGGAALVAVLANGRTRVLARGYPAAWLEAVGRLLASRHRAHTGRPLTVLGEAAETLRPIADDLLTPPPGTRVRVERRPGGVRLLVPAPGLRQTRKNRAVFSILWTGAGAILVAGMNGLFPVSRHPLSGKLFLLVLVVFAVVSVVVVLLAMHRGYLRALIDADASGLRAALVSPLRRRTIFVPRDDIADVRVGPGGFSFDDTPLMELQVVRKHSGATLGLLSNLSDYELCWMASLLRDVLKRQA